MDVSALQLKSGDRVLDVGCGEGTRFASFAGKAIEYEGLDASPDSVSRANAAVRDVLANFRVGVATQLPYEDASFDVVLLLDVLGGVAPDARPVVLRETQRVLKRGGTAHVRVANRWHPRHWFDARAAFTRRRLAALADRAGLVVAETRGVQAQLMLTVRKP